MSVIRLNGPSINNPHVNTTAGIFNPSALGINNQVGGASLQAVGGGPIVNTGLAGGVQINPNISPAVPQTDLLPLQGKTAGQTVVVDLGAVLKFVDFTATPWPPTNIVMVDPNGILHDLALFTVTKSTGSGFGPIPQLPPGRYTFMALATLTDCDIYVQHYGARNLV